MEKEIISEGNIIKLLKDKKLPYTNGIGEILFEELTANKDLPFQINGLTEEVDTYASFLSRCIRTATKMRSKGITENDIITVCTHNHLDTNVPIVASLLIGVKSATIDPNLSLSDSKHLLNLTKPKMIFASHDSLKLVEDATREIGCESEIIVFGESTEHTRFSEFLEDAPREKEFVPVKTSNLKDTACIFFSSGTTGLAKGICLSHLVLISQLPTKKKLQHSLGGTVLNYSSPYWISSLLMLFHTIVSKSNRLVYPNFDIPTLWKGIEKYKVNMLLLSPTQLANVCGTRKPKDVNTSSLRVLLFGGSPISTKQQDEIRKLLPTTLVISGYGQTEMGGGCLTFSLDEMGIRYFMQKPTSCGRPQPGYEYKVVDLETETPLGPNQPGELRIKTDFCMNGYYGVDSSDSWDSDGFLKTGDVAYYDDDYFFYIEDRIKEMLKFQGWQITPAKLESVLLTHPHVETALVIGLPHPVDVDHPTGIVKLKDSAPKTTPEEINKYFEEKIDDDKYRLRGGLKIVNSIPVTPTGKYRIRYLKDLILAGAL